MAISPQALQFSIKGVLLQLIPQSAHNFYDDHNVFPYSRL